MNIIVENGNDESRMFEVLKEIDEMTSIDQIRKPNGSITVEIGQGGWVIENSFERENDKFPIKGKRFPALEQTLGEIEHEIDLKTNTSLSVLSLAKTDTHKTWDGRILVTWILINPAIPYEMKEDVPEFLTKEIPMSVTEYEICAESGIAFYDEVNEILYPIRECAFPSLGKMMDTEASFKYKSRFPLGSALMIAENLYRSTYRGLKMLIRGDIHSRFRPVIGIVSNRYIRYMHSDFIKGCLDIISRMNGISALHSWKVNEEITLVKVRIMDLGMHMFEFRLVNSDAPGTGISVSLYAVFGDVAVFVKKNSTQHWKCFEKNGREVALFEGMEDAMREFVELCEFLKLRQTSVSLQYFNLFEPVVGKKRLRNVQKEKAYGRANALEMCVAICELMALDLCKNQVDLLEKQYRKLFDMVAEKCKPMSKAI